MYEGESINKVNLHFYRYMYPLCTQELSTALGYYMSEHAVLVIYIFYIYIKANVYVYVQD
jgi:hypothetical protein